MVAQYCEGAAGWRCWQEFSMTSKFRGKYLQIIPLGSAYVEFNRTGNKYKWRKVTDVTRAKSLTNIAKDIRLSR